MTQPNPQPEPTTPYEGLTYEQLQNQTLAWIGRTTVDADPGELILVQGLINEGIARIQQLFPGLVHLRKKYTVTTTAGEATIPLPLGVMHVHDPILLDGAPVYGRGTVLNNMLQDPNVDMTTLAQNRQYSVDWGVDDSDPDTMAQAILTFYPAPSQNGSVVIFATGQDDALSDPLDLARIPVAYISSLSYYAVQPLLSSRSRSKDLAMAQAKWKADLEEIEGLRLRQRTRGGDNMKIPNGVRSIRGRRFPGGTRVIP